MNCCGNKRKEWMNEVKTSIHPETNENDSEPKVVNNPDRMFEYTGNYSLKITGLSSGKSYQFRFNGDKLLIDYADSFALMAERDLKILPTIS
jgi:1,4-alpha-glucan branching enzyme